MSPNDDRLGPQAGLYPAVSMGDGQWERVMVALWRTGTKTNAALAKRIDGDVQAWRRLALTRTDGGRS